MESIKVQIPKSDQSLFPKAKSIPFLLLLNGFFIDFPNKQKSQSLILPQQTREQKTAFSSHP